MAWYFVVLKTAFITPNLHVRLDVRWYLLRFPVQAAMNELHIQFLVTLCDPCCLRGQKLMRSRVVQCHVLIILFLAGRFNSGGFRTNLIIEVCLTFRGHFWCFLFLTGIDL